MGGIRFEQPLRPEAVCHGDEIGQMTAALHAGIAPGSSWAVVRGDRGIGWLALVPAEPGFGHVSAYLSPADRNAEISLYSAALALGRYVVREAHRRGYTAIAANPMDTNEQAAGLRRYCRALGIVDSGVVLPLRGPVHICPLRPEAVQLNPGELARRCFPDIFRQAEDLGALMYEKPSPEALQLLGRLSLSADSDRLRE